MAKTEEDEEDEEENPTRVVEDGDEGHDYDGNEEDVPDHGPGSTYRLGNRPTLGLQGPRRSKSHDPKVGTALPDAIGAATSRATFAEATS